MQDRFIHVHYFLGELKWVCLAYKKVNKFSPKMFLMRAPVGSHHFCGRTDRQECKKLTLDKKNFGYLVVKTLNFV